MRMKKKGALELSINAIVILILAITMLGLGLGFMKKTFGGVTDQFGTVSEQMKKEMIDRLKESGKKIDLDVTNFDMKTSEKKTVYLALKNDYDMSQEFTICTEDNSATCTLPSGLATISCVPEDGTTTDCDAISVRTFKSKFIKAGDIDVIPIEISVDSRAKRTMFMFTLAAEPTSTGAGESSIINFYLTVG